MQRNQSLTGYVFKKKLTVLFSRGYKKRNQSFDSLRFGMPSI